MIFIVCVTEYTGSLKAVVKEIIANPKKIENAIYSEVFARKDYTKITSQTSAGTFYCPKNNSVFLEEHFEAKQLKVPKPMQKVLRVSSEKIFLSDTEYVSKM